jgi:hypothetical protein
MACAHQCYIGQLTSEAHHLFAARADGNGHLVRRWAVQVCFVQRECLTLHGHSLTGKQALDRRYAFPLINQSARTRRRSGE